MVKRQYKLRKIMWLRLVGHITLYQLVFCQKTLVLNKFVYLTDKGIKYTHRLLSLSQYKVLFFHFFSFYIAKHLTDLPLEKRNLGLVISQKYQIDLKHSSIV